MAGLMMEVYGSEVEVTERDRERIGSTWAQFHTHLYSNFYGYQYATGIPGADHLVQREAGGHPEAAEFYRGFPKRAGAESPARDLSPRGGASAAPPPAV